MTTVATRPGDRAYQALRQEILDGLLAPGSRLKEEEMAARIGVSRTPIREALRRLVAEGLAERNDGGSTIRVPDLSLLDIEDAFRLRGVLEAYAVRQAARRITPTALDQLQSLVDGMEGLVATRVKQDGYLALNSAFHRLIVEAAGSRRLPALMPYVIDLPIVVRTFHAFDQAALERSNFHHRELVAALRQGDSDWAAAVMRSHIANAWSSLRHLLPPHRSHILPSKEADDDGRH